jgi:uncharacterized protein YrrD
MLRVGSALKGYAIEASDENIGTVSDLLFDDDTWKVRWLVVDTGSWLTGRKVLLHPSSIGQANYMHRTLSVSLTKAKVEGSPNILTDQPVSRQMQDSLLQYYGWDPLWGGSRFERGVMASPLGPSHNLDAALRNASSFEAHLAGEDPHLRSMVAVTGYHCHASDGDIGHVEDFLVDDGFWGIAYLIVDTRNWWPGKHVLVSPHAVMAVSWSDRQVVFNVSREQVKASPPWAPLDIVDQSYEERLHRHYGWPCDG